MRELTDAFSSALDGFSRSIDALARSLTAARNISDELGDYKPIFDGDRSPEPAEAFGATETLFRLVAILAAARLEQGRLFKALASMRETMKLLAKPGYAKKEFRRLEEHLSQMESMSRDLSVALNNVVHLSDSRAIDVADLPSEMQSGPDDQARLDQLRERALHIQTKSRHHVVPNHLLLNYATHAASERELSQVYWETLRDVLHSQPRITHFLALTAADLARTWDDVHVRRSEFLLHLWRPLKTYKYRRRSPGSDQLALFEDQTEISQDFEIALLKVLAEARPDLLLQVAERTFAQLRSGAHPKPQTLRAMGEALLELAERVDGASKTPPVDSDAGNAVNGGDLQRGREGRR